MKIVPKKAAATISTRVTPTEVQVESVCSRFAPPTDAARLRAAELKPASAQAEIKRRIAPVLKRDKTRGEAFNKYIEL